MTQLTWRLLPPASGPAQAMVANGRNHAAAPGTFVDVVDADAKILKANGWLCGIPSGPTANRPAPRLNEPYNAVPGFLFVDTTISAVIMWDGATWRSVLTGAAV